VWVSLEELKCRVPIRRSGLEIHPAAEDFDNPSLLGEGVPGATSGSRGPRMRVTWDWDLTAEHAVNEVLLHEAHGLAGVPFALWLPIPPSIAGIHNTLVGAKCRRPPARWFSHLDLAALDVWSRDRLAVEYVIWCARRQGLAVARPEFAPPDRAGAVAGWLAGVGGRGVVRTYASSAVRVAQAAMDGGLDIRGGVFLTGAEPLTERRLKRIESAGAQAFSRYSAAESGLIAASCPHRVSADDMHVYLDRLAVIAPREDRLLFSSMSPHTGKVLLNTDIGDRGRLTSRACDCVFGRLGLDVRVAHVRSDERLTGEGMAVLATELDEIVAGLVARAGGGTEDYQFWETEDERGLARLVVAVSPRVTGLRERQFEVDLLDRVRAASRGGSLAADLWGQSATLQVLRVEPRVTPGHKQRTYVPRPLPRRVKGAATPPWRSPQ
jgi:hypothetical protein